MLPFRVSRRRVGKGNGKGVGEGRVKRFVGNKKKNAQKKKSNEIDRVGSKRKIIGIVAKRASRRVERLCLWRVTGGK